MANIQVAYFPHANQSVILVPLGPLFSVCSDDEKQEILARLQSCVDHAKRAPLEGIVVVTTLAQDRVIYTAPRSFTGALPKVTWLGLLRMLNRHLLCNDPLIVAFVRAASFEENQGAPIRYWAMRAD